MTLFLRFFGHSCTLYGVLRILCSCMVAVAWDLWLLSGDPPFIHEALTRHHPGALLGVHPRNGEYAKVKTLQSHTSGVKESTDNTENDFPTCLPITAVGQRDPGIMTMITVLAGC